MSDEPLALIQKRMDIDEWEDDDFPLFPSDVAMKRLEDWIAQAPRPRLLYELALSLLGDVFLWDGVLAGVLSSEYDACAYLFDSFHLSEDRPAPEDKVAAVEALDEMIVRDEIRLYAHAGEALDVLLIFAAHQTPLQVRARKVLLAFPSIMRELLHSYTGLPLAKSQELSERMLSRIFSQYVCFYASE